MARPYQLIVIRRTTIFSDIGFVNISIGDTCRKYEARLAGLVDLYTGGLIDGPVAENDIADATVKRNALEARIADQKEPTLVELHPGTVEQYFETIDTLIWKLTDLNPQLGRELVEILLRSSLGSKFFLRQFKGIS
jgi:hypothetical protein